VKKIGVGIVGTGFGRSAQVPGFEACEGVEIVAVCSGHEERARKVAFECGAQHAFTDYRDMMQLEGLDLVSIVTPPYLHQPMTAAAVAAGKHVICEKPMAMNADEAREMLHRAESAGVLHLIDHELRFNPTRQRIKQLLQEGYVGRVYHIAVNVITAFRADPLQRTWDWWSQAEKGGGSVGATASHLIDLLRWWLGEPSAVSGQLNTFVKRRKPPDSDEFREVTSDDQCSFMAEFANGVLASVFITSVARHPQGSRTEIHGEAGSLILDADDRLWGRRAGESDVTELTVPDPNRDLARVEKNVWAVSFVGLARHAVECIRAGKQAEQGATFYDGLRAQQVMDAIRESWQARRWVEVPAA
jgi:predicted dehydrogenase